MTVATPISSLEQLRSITLIVADSGDLPSVKRWSPADTTTNPSLLWQIAQQPEQAALINELRQSMTHSKSNRLDHHHDQFRFLSMQFAVKIGSQILRHIPGRISTEVSSELSFNISATQRAAHDIINLYQREKIEPERVLIKIAATHEGITTARLLQREGIRCNLTLVFNLMQAASCADAGVTLISPFVGRISDWHQQHSGHIVNHEQALLDPGVLSVQNIYHYLKQHQYPTEIMAASFRYPQQALALAGCDAMTLAPAILQALDQLQQKVAYSPLLLHAPENVAPLNIDEPHFRWTMNQDVMAHHLLADGIRRFAQDEQRLKTLLSDKHS